MPNLLRIEMDVATDMACHGPKGDYTVPYKPARLKALLTKAGKKHAVTVALVVEDGPGGGNPLYAFTGTRQALESYIRAEYDPNVDGPDSDGMDFYFEAAEEV